MIWLLNSEIRELTPFFIYLLWRQKREVHQVILEKVREYVEKVVSNENLDFWIICLQQLSHNHQLNTALFPITSLSTDNRVIFVLALHLTNSVKLTSFNSTFLILLLILFSEIHLLGNFYWLVHGLFKVADSNTVGLASRMCLCKLKALHTR